jgi:dATP pyrophosphohydrolase
VLVVIYADDGQTLLLNRRQPFAFWQSVTGSIEAGESAADAAAREVEEETGLRPAGALIDTGTARRFEIDPRWRSRYAEGVTHNTEYEWRLRLETVVPIRICTAEHSEFGWFDLDHAIDAVWSWTNREALQDLKASLS